MGIRFDGTVIHFEPADVIEGLGALLASHAIEPRFSEDEEAVLRAASVLSGQSIGIVLYALATAAAQIARPPRGEIGERVNRAATLARLTIASNVEQAIILLLGILAMLADSNSLDDALDLLGEILLQSDVAPGAIEMDLAPLEDTPGPSGGDGKKSECPNCGRPGGDGYSLCQDCETKHTAGAAEPATE